MIMTSNPHHRVTSGGAFEQVSFIADEDNTWITMPNQLGDVIRAQTPGKPNLPSGATYVSYVRDGGTGPLRYRPAGPLF